MNDVTVHLDLPQVIRLVDTMVARGWTTDNALAHLNGTCDPVAVCNGEHRDPAPCPDCGHSWPGTHLAAHRAGIVALDTNPTHLCGGVPAQRSGS